jgi:lambda family phage minor tail protein L
VTPGIAARTKQIEPGQLVELFILDLSLLGGPLLYFTNSTAPGGASGSIVFQGNTYVAYPIQGNGWDVTSQGTLPRPSIAVSNIGSVTTALMQQYNDFVGATVTRKRTYAQFLDGAPGANPLEEFQPDIFVINAKKSETNTEVVFELATKADSEGVLIPLRQIIANSCQWIFRGPDCGFVGPPVTDKYGNNFGAQFTDGVINGTTTLISATATFVAGDVGKTITGDGIPSSTTISARVSATQVTLSHAATTSATGTLFTIVGRITDRGAYNAVTVYASGDYTYTLVNGIRVYWVSQKATNTDPLTTIASWKMDMCGKQLSDCKAHFGANNPLPTSAFPGSNLIPAG